MNNTSWEEKYRQIHNMGYSSCYPYHISLAYLRWQQQVEWTDVKWASSAFLPKMFSDAVQALGLGKHSWEQKGVNAPVPKGSWQIHASDSFLSGGQFQGHPSCFSAVLAEFDPSPYSDNIITPPISISFFLVVFLLPHFYFMRSPSTKVFILGSAFREPE